MSKYKLNIRVCKGMESRNLETYTGDTDSFIDGFYVKDLTVFDKASYLKFDVAILPDAEEVE